MSDPLRQGNLSEEAARIVRDALVELRELRAEADLSKDQEYALAAVIANAVKRGVQLGAVEITAQAIELGISELNLKIDMGDPLSPDDLTP